AGTPPGPFTKLSQTGVTQGGHPDRPDPRTQEFMTPAALLLAPPLFSVGGFWIGKTRSLALVGGTRGVRNLHSLPSHYGVMTAMWCALPALAVILLWVAFQDAIILRLVTSQLPANLRE